MKTPLAANKINYTLYSESGSRMSTLIIRPDCILFLRVESRAGALRPEGSNQLQKGVHSTIPCMHVLSRLVEKVAVRNSIYMPEHGEGVPL